MLLNLVTVLLLSKKEVHEYPAGMTSASRAKCHDHLDGETQKCGENCIYTSGDITCDHYS